MVPKMEYASNMEYRAELLKQNMTTVIYRPVLALIQQRSPVILVFLLITGDTGVFSERYFVHHAASCKMTCWTVDFADR